MMNVMVGGASWPVECVHGNLSGRLRRYSEKAMAVALGTSNPNPVVLSDEQLASRSGEVDPVASEIFGEHSSVTYPRHLSKHG